MSTKEKRIGFVGLGRMGANMARNLKDKGYQISTVYDINENVASSLANELGSQTASSLSEVTANSDIILTVVTNDAAMESIFFNNEDNLFLNSSGKLFINCATLSPDLHIRLESSGERVAQLINNLPEE